ncbi:hypothetical protein BSKO_01609 [Bryopsis sp. KO-2023]|nr:hypothetical protein BSKO_01609 [Bryopsis sp. KO-2023]
MSRQSENGMGSKERPWVGMRNSHPGKPPPPPPVQGPVRQLSSVSLSGGFAAAGGEGFLPRVPQGQHVQRYPSCPSLSSPAFPSGSGYPGNIQHPPSQPLPLPPRETLSAKKPWTFNQVLNVVSAFVLVVNIVLAIWFPHFQRGAVLSLLVGPVAIAVAWFAVTLEWWDCVDSGNRNKTLLAGLAAGLDVVGVVALVLSIFTADCGDDPSDDCNRDVRIGGVIVFISSAGMLFHGILCVKLIVASNWANADAPVEDPSASSNYPVRSLSNGTDLERAASGSMQMYGGARSFTMAPVPVFAHIKQMGSFVGPVQMRPPPQRR